MIVLIKKDLIDLVTEIKFKTVSLGIMGQANKGAVAISMKFSDKRLLFINCHLEAHNENRNRRKDQFD
jgi:hypothetical protein